MPLSFVAQSTFFGTTSTTFSVNKPTGTVDGDIMIAMVMHQDTDSSGYPTTIPSGWTSLGQIRPNSETYYIEYFYRIASSEGSSYTWGFSASINSRTSGIIATYRGGFNIASPIDVVSNTGYNTDDSLARAASMTVAAANSPLIYIGCLLTGGGPYTFTKPTNPNTNWVEDYDNGDATASIWIEVASMQWTGSGSTGNMDGSFTGGANQRKHGFAVALKPEGLNNSNFFMMF